MARIPDCHPDRKHQAKGLCDQCYQRQYQRERWQRLHRKDPSEYAPNYRKPPRKPARVNECGHPERRHCAMGMCAPCWKRRRAEAGEGMATCHPDRPVVARGMCNACYAKFKYWGEPEKARAAANEAHRRASRRIRDELIAAYGSRCACTRCPETNPAFLTLEHTERNGKEHRKQVGSHSYRDLRRRGWPKEGFTLLCWNCNAMTRFGQPCPHEVGG